MQRVFVASWSKHLLDEAPHVRSICPPALAPSMCFPLHLVQPIACCERSLPRKLLTQPTKKTTHLCGAECVAGSRASSLFCCISSILMFTHPPSVLFPGTTRPIPFRLATRPSPSPVVAREFLDRGNCGRAGIVSHWLGLSLDRWIADSPPLSSTVLHDCLGALRRIAGRRVAQPYTPFRWTAKYAFAFLRLTQTHRTIDASAEPRNPQMQARHPSNNDDRGVRDAER